MADLQFYANKGSGFVLIPPPEEWEGLNIETNFVNSSSDAQIRTTTLTWVAENAAMLFKWFTDGNNGGKGIFEGPGFRIQACGLTIFEGCFDMTSKETTFTCDIIKASIKETTFAYNLYDDADSFTFDYLKRTGAITNADAVSVPYVINDPFDYFQIAILANSFVSIYKLLRDAYHTLAALVDEITGDTTAATATGGLTVAQLIADLLIVALYLLYFAALMAVMIALLIIVFNMFIGPVKYKKGMRLVDLCTKGAQRMGLTLSSTILQTAPYKDAVIIPTKQSYFNDNNFVEQFFANAFTRKLYDDNQNQNQNWVYEGTFGQLLRQISDIFNCTNKASGQTGIVVRNGVLHIEKWDFFANQAVFTMPPQSEDAPFEDPYGTNASEIAATYRVAWMTDSIDWNTKDRYDGTSASMTLQPITVGNSRNLLLKTLDEKLLAFALAKRKETLTNPEKIVGFIVNMASVFFNILVSIVNFFGGNLTPLPTNSFGARIGVMLLHSDFIGVQKFLVVDRNNNVHQNNSLPGGLGYTDAYYIAKTFHRASWAVDTISSPITYPNQYLTFKGKEIPLCCSDYLALKGNNLIKDQQQRIGRVDSVRWNPRNETAEIDYRIKQVYTKNLKQQITIDGKAV